MRTEDKILNFLKYSGPSLTMKIANNIKENSIIASAYLSELSSQRKIKISNLKIGTSPLYYLPGQEDQLIRFTKDINPKDREVLERLHQKKVLRENNLELLAKVALRSLKDFAIPLHVNFNGQKELFWRWHLLSDEETNQIISEILGQVDISQPETSINEPQQIQPAVKEETQQVQDTTTEEFQKEILKENIEPKPETEIKEKEEIKQQVVEEKPKFESYPPNTAQNIQPIKKIESYPPNTAITGRGGINAFQQTEDVEPKKEILVEIKEEPKVETVEAKNDKKEEVVEPVKDETTESKVEEYERKEVIKKHSEEKSTPEKEQDKGQTKLSEVKEKETEESKETKEEVKNVEVKKESKETEKEKEESESNEDLEEKPKKKSLMSKIKEKFTGKYKKKIEKGFLDKVSNYLDSLDIKIESKEMVRKNSELNFIINVPSTIGRIKYYCKAKNKNKCDEKDLSAAYMESQMKKMPLLFLYSCEINKKAIEMIESDAFDNLIVKRIEREV